MASETLGLRADVLERGKGEGASHAGEGGPSSPHPSPLPRREMFVFVVCQGRGEGEPLWLPIGHKINCNALEPAGGELHEVQAFSGEFAGAAAAGHAAAGVGEMGDAGVLYPGYDGG
jgi:hypothetical protein